jgi:hypothetical protein
MQGRRGRDARQARSNQTWTLCEATCLTDSRKQTRRGDGTSRLQADQMMLEQTWNESRVDCALGIPRLGRNGISCCWSCCIRHACCIGHARGNGIIAKLELLHSSGAALVLFGTACSAIRLCSAMWRTLLFGVEQQASSRLGAAGGPGVEQALAPLARQQALAPLARRQASRRPADAALAPCAEARGGSHAQAAGTS